MEPTNTDKIETLIHKGVRIPNPLTLEIGDDLDPARISGEGVTIHAGCRIRGAKTTIAAGCSLGAQAPVTLEDCWLGRDVALNGGSFYRAVFLDSSSLGSGAQVREGCLLEEQARGAHTVGLKQTILFPFVTLGSLINLCDVLMAGGTSRKDHSEVGSSYIHFNFTPDADKATASLLGDVSRGVMLNQPRIFLGGQGGLVGPARIGYGNVIAAGGVFRGDFLQQNRLLVANTPRGGNVPYRSGLYPGFKRIFTNNLVYIANLHALDQWYRHARRRFFQRWPFGEQVFEGALEILGLAVRERVGRLGDFLERLGADRRAGGGLRAALFDRRDALLEQLAAPDVADVQLGQRDSFLAGLQRSAQAVGGDSFVATVQHLDPQTAGDGTAWLQAIVDRVSDSLWRSLPVP